MSALPNIQSGGLLDAGDAMLAHTEHAHLSRQVTYRRAAGGDPLTVRASVGRTIFRLQDGSGGGAVVHKVSRDYLIRADELVSAQAGQAGQQCIPAEGDTITDTVAGVSRTYEVRGPGGDEPDWRWSDPSALVYRLHTIDVTPASSGGGSGGGS
jgi:hypothetical protein